MISKKEFYVLCNRNSPKNKNRHIGPIDARYFLRDMSLHVAYFFAQKNISANNATLLFLLVSVLANVLIAVPSLLSLVSAIGLYEFGQLLDCVDGQLARFYATRSVYGEELDNFSHTVIHGTAMIAFGLRLYISNNNPLFLVLGAIGAFSFAVGSHSHGEYAASNTASSMTDLRWYKKQIDFVLEEVRMFALLMLLCYIIQRYILPIPLAEMAFVFACAYTFLNNVILAFSKTVKKAELVEKTDWKGWA